MKYDAELLTQQSERINDESAYLKRQGWCDVHRKRTAAVKTCVGTMNPREQAIHQRCVSTWT